jgi:RNA polymerase sigma factor for flagellar operon FliA
VSGKKKAAKTGKQRASGSTAARKPGTVRQKSARGGAAKAQKVSTKNSKTKTVKRTTPPKQTTTATSVRSRSKERADARTGKGKAASTKAAAKAPTSPATAGAAASARVRKGQRPTTEELWDLPTEDIWSLYRTATSAKQRDDDWIEELRNVLMELHYPLVRHIAERLLQTLPKSIELDDLVSAGLFGLMDAIRGFDPDRGIKFKTYCTTRIRGSILDQLRSQDWVPRLVRLKAGKIEKALHRLQGEYGREPTHAELARELDMSHVELSTEIVSARAKTMFSLSDRWDDRDDDSPMEKMDIVEDKTSIDPVGELNRRDLMIYITRSLTHKERFIIEQYYQVGHTMREIGEMLALTESRVCQIHSNVMSRLKGLLGPKVDGLIS